MSKIFLIRTTMAIEQESYYSAKTDVWLLGDVQGYKAFIKLLRLAISTKHNQRNLHLWSLARNECNMLLSILPPMPIKNKSPKIKFWERFVYYKSKPWMELVIAGNLSGLERFASEVESLLRKTTGDPSDHMHFDSEYCGQSWIMPRSIALNLRDPLKKWDLKKLQENGYDYFFTKKSPETIPADLHYRLRQKGQKYHEIPMEKAHEIWEYI
jgi:hypothetical protein